MSIKIYVKYVKNNRDFHTTKLNLPTGNLDDKTTGEVIAFLKKSARRFHQTIVLITHDLELAKQADVVITISDGQIVAVE